MKLIVVHFVPKGEEKIVTNIKHHVLCDMEQKLHGHQAAKRKIFTHEVDRKKLFQ